MSSITSLISGGGGGGGTPVNSIARLFVSGVPLYTDETGGVWLKTGNTITPDTSTYPDANISNFVLAAVYEKLFSVAAQETNPYAVQLNNDGTKMFIVGTTGDDINEYSLSTAYDIATASFTTSVLVSSQTTVPIGLKFKPDGTKVYVVSNDSMIYQYSLSTAFDISTLSYDGISYNSSAQVGSSKDVEFNNDGTKMYVGDNYKMFQYSLSTAYDISTASYDNKSILDNLTIFDGIRFNGDGSKLAVVSSFETKIEQFNLSTNYDISTAIKTATFTVIDSLPHGLDFGNNYTKMYVVGRGGDAVYQYDMTPFMGLSTDTATYDYIKLK